MVLLGDHAMVWPGNGAPLIADAHFGKAAAFRGAATAGAGRHHRRQPGAAGKN